VTKLGRHGILVRAYSGVLRRGGRSVKSLVRSSEFPIPAVKGYLTHDDREFPSPCFGIDEVGLQGGRRMTTSPAQYADQKRPRGTRSNHARSS